MWVSDSDFWFSPYQSDILFGRIFKKNMHWLGLETKDILSVDKIENLIHSLDLHV